MCSHLFFFHFNTLVKYWENIDAIFAEVERIGNNTKSRTVLRRLYCRRTTPLETGVERQRCVDC